MKGEQGRRGPLKPLAGLLGRFSMDALRQRQKQEADREAARSLERLRAVAAAQMERSRRAPSTIPDKRGITKRPMAHVKHERRAANRRAKLARRVNRTA